MKTPRKQKKTAVKRASGRRPASLDSSASPSPFGGSLLSLESRIMFDGAAVATASIVSSEQIAQNQAEDSFSDGDAGTTDISTDTPTDDQSLFDALEALDVSAARQETLFVSASTLDYQQLLDGVSSNIGLYGPDPARDGVEQIANILSNQMGIDAAPLIGAGTEAEKYLGTSLLTQDSISTTNAEQFQQIDRSLLADAGLLIDGHSFVQGGAGQLVIGTFVDFTDAEVAASKDRNGDTTESADWLLEVTTGSIETSNTIRDTTGRSGTGQGNLISSTTAISNSFDLPILGYSTLSNTELGVYVEGVPSATANDGLAANAQADADSTSDVIGGELASARVEIVFVDTSVENYKTLIDGIDNPDARVVLLDASRDGMDQIVSALGQMGRVDAIHLISHGDEGELKLGSMVLTGDNMQGEYADELAAIKEHLTDQADILVYGCSFGKGEAGAAAAETLGRLTGADVAASTDATGHAELGGDWDLELKQGSIETDLAVDHDAQNNWSGLLGVLDWDAQTWTAGIATPAVQTLTLADGSTVTVTLTQNAVGTLTSAATSTTYTGGLLPVQSALQLGMAINPSTDTITVRVDFSSQPGGSVNNASLTLFDVDNNEFAIFSSNLGNPTSATVSATNTFNGTNRVSGNGGGANQTTGDGNTTVSFNQAGITWVEFTYGSTSNANPIVILHDIMFNSIADSNAPKLDLNDNDASVSASDNFNTIAYNNASGGTIPWASNWIEVDAAGAGAGAGEVRVFDVDGGPGVDGEIRIGRDTNAVSSIQRSVDLTNYVNPTLSFNYNTSGTLENADTLVVEVSKDAGVSFTTLQTFTNDGTGTANLNLSGYESGNTIIRFRVTGGYTAADEFFYVDNVAISAEQTGFSSSYTEGGTGAAIGDTDVVITDANSANMSGGKVSIITNFTAGDTLSFTNVGGVSGSYNSGTGVLTISGTGTIAEYQTFLAGVRYSSTNDDPTVGGTKTTRVISTIVQDQTTLNPSNTAFSTVTITPVNDAPVVSGASGTLAYSEGNGTQVIDSTLTITDADDTNIESATVSISGGFVSAEDVLSFTAGSGITGSFNTGTGVLTLSGTATKAQYEAVLETVTYQNTNTDNPNTGNRTVTWVVNDGDVNSTGVTSTITVANINDAPTATNLSAAETYVEDMALNLIDIVASDVDSASVTVTLTLSDVAAGSLNTGSSGAVTSTFVGGVWTASGAKADVNALLAGLTFTPALDYNSNFTIATSVSDGVAAAVTGSKAITGTSVNDAPSLSATAQSPSFTEAPGLGTQAAAVTIFSAAAVNTVEAGQTVLGLTFTVSGLADGANERIVVDGTTITLGANSSGTTTTNGMTYSVTISGSTATVALTKGTGVATANVNTLINAITYQNTNTDNPTAGGRVFTITSLQDSGGTASGGVDTSNPALSSTVTVTAVNDAPTITVTATTNFTEDSGAAVGDVVASYSTGDEEGAAVTVAVSDTVNYALDGLGNVTLTAAGLALVNSGVDLPAFTLTPNDGTINGAAANVDPSVTAVNDAPVAGDDTASTNEDTAVTTGNVLGNDTDVDSVLNAASITAFDAVSVNGGTVVYNNDGTFTYTPAANFTGVDTFTYTVSDGALTDTATVTITVNPVNDNFTDADEVVTTNEDTAVSGNVLTGTSSVDGLVSVTQFTVAGDVTVYLAGQIATISGVGTLQLAANGNYTFTPVTNYNGPVPVVTYMVTDGSGTDDTSTLTITVNPVDDVTVLSEDTQTSFEDTVATGNVLANDSDADNPLTVTQFTVAGDVSVYAAGSTATIPGVGMVVLNANGAYTFMPVANYSGPVPAMTYTVNTGATSTLTITVTPFFPPLLNRPQASDPAVTFSRLAAPPPVGIEMPVMPPPELPWSPNGQNLDAMPFDITKVPEESAPYKAIPNPTFDSLGQPDTLIQDQPSDLSRPWPSCPVESPSTPSENMMSVSHNITEPLTKVADNLEQSIELRDRQTDLVGRVAPFFGIALSAGFAAWILRGGSLMKSFVASMPAWRHVDPLSVLGAGSRRRDRDRKVREDDKKKNG